MTICEHCAEPVEFEYDHTDEYGMRDAGFMCPNMHETVGVYVEDETLRRYFRRFGFPNDELAKHVTIKYIR